jgi:amino acid permease
LSSADVGEVLGFDSIGDALGISVVVFAAAWGLAFAAICVAGLAPVAAFLLAPFFVVVLFLMPRRKKRERTTPSKPREPRE